MRAVIFGAGRVGIDFYLEIKKNADVISFIDNDVNKQGKEISGVMIRSAKELAELQYDIIYIACLKNYRDIEEQLIDLGIELDKLSLRPIDQYNNKMESIKIMNSLYSYHEAYNKNEYEEKWNKIKKEHKKIAIYLLRAEAIGELVQCFIPIWKAINDDNILRVFIPYVGEDRRISNKYLLKLFEQKIYIVHENEILFWTYVLKTHLEEVDVSEYHKHESKNKMPSYMMDNEECPLCFSDVELNKGREFLRHINLKKPFVCVTARTPAYNVNTIGHDFEYEYRNMNFMDYKMAISYLQKQNIMTVRMGRMESPIDKIDSCIDYAGRYADDFRDIYLASQCEFYIANSTGSIYMALLFARPVLMVNSVPNTFGYGGSPYTEQDLFIPKKYYDENKGRYLSLREMIKVESQCLIWGNRYKEMGIRFIDNTPEEILTVTEEMLKRLRGEWRDSPEDEKNYERYLGIYHEMAEEAKNNPDNWLGEPNPARISATYLRNNLYLLD